MADSIQTDYKDLQCYKKMNDEHRKSYDHLASHYGSLLNQGPEKRKTIYTLHDFDHHCFDIYRIISLDLLGEQGLTELNEEERYLLNLAVLFHDIGMCEGGWVDGKKTAPDRNIHSLQAAQWLRHEYRTQNTILQHHGDLTYKQLNMVCLMCKAHSDVKGVDTNEYHGPGLSNPALRDSERGKTSIIRVKALAGILRVADELDVVSNRLGNARGEAALQDGDKEDNISRVHWERLHWIQDIESSENTSDLSLVLDKEEVQKRINAGDLSNIREGIQTIQTKIQKELDALWNMALEANLDAGRITTKRFVRIKTDIPDLSEESSKTSLNVSRTTIRDTLSEELQNDILGYAEQTVIESPNVKILDPSLSKEVSQYISKNELLKVGHFQLNSTYCARDWIETGSLLIEHELTSKIVETISDAIFVRHSNWKYVIVGLDLSGTILAAQVANALQRPFTYIIPAHQKRHSDHHEIDVPKLAEDDKIILVTDSIATGSTFISAIQELKWENRILGIFSVLYRPPRTNVANQIKNTNYEIYAVNADFPIEISEITNCPYGVDDCRAENRRYSE